MTRVVTEYSFTHLRSIERSLVEADDIPLVGGVPDFPLDSLAQTLRTLFHLDSIEIMQHPSRWVKAETLYGDGVEAIALSCPALDGELAWLISTTDLKQIVQVLGGGPHTALLADHPLKQGFARFLATEVIGALHTVDYPTPLIPQLANTPPLRGPALATECVVRCGSIEATMRLLISEAFCLSMRHQFAQAKPTHLSEKIARQVSTTVCVQIGKAELSTEEFRNLAIGDFVALDKSRLDPLSQEGTAILEAAGKPFAQAKVHGSQLELQELDYG